MLMQYAKLGKLLHLVLALGLVLTLGSSVAGPPYAVQAQEIGPQSSPLGTGFTYQGRLIKNDVPVDGVTCDFTFDLYDGASGGTPLDTDSKTAEVSDGYFTAMLDFGGDTFTGKALWLEIAVQCPGDGSPVPLDDQRVALNAAPYAHGLRPGAILEGSATGPYPRQGTFNVQNNSLSAGHAAIFGVSGSGLGGYPGEEVGVRGEAADGYGVAGRSANSIGVYGSSDGSYGVWGFSTSDYGVMGQSTSSYGVYASGGAGDLQLGNGTIQSTASDSSDLILSSSDHVDIHLDDDGNSASRFRILNDLDAVVFAVDESGTITGSVGGGGGWSLTGNAGTDPSANFLGTTDNQALELRVNDSRALRLEPSTSSPNLIGGYGGNSVSAGVEGATISGGGRSGAPNRANADFATVGGGGVNAATGREATVSGGWNNKASHQNAVVAGGSGNEAKGANAAVGGGWNNAAGGDNATIGGGEGNTTTGDATTISGGGDNTADNNYATIGGGIYNTITGETSTIGGGGYISVTGGAATVGGGLFITVTGDYATVGGGGFNTASGVGAVVAGGGGEDPILVRSLPNTASGMLSVIGGGGLNTASEGYATISGGLGNRAGAWGATVGGGEQITVTNNWSTVSGGKQNVADGEYATIGGGYLHSVEGDYATVCGGWSNTAKGGQATVCGGYDNEAIGNHAAIGGGYNNEAIGDFATVLGGHSAEASHFGEVAHASGSFGETGDAQGAFYILRGTTYDDTPTELFLDGGSQRLTVVDRTMTYDILVVARTAVPWSAGFTAQGVIEGYGFGSVGMIGSPIITPLGDQIGGTNLSVLAEQGALVLKVTGPSDKTVRWVATVRTAEVGW